MSNGIEENKVLLRTFDLPDIHFASVTGLDNGGNRFLALRSVGSDSIDAMALGRWHEQSKLAEDAEARRDCWLQINDRIYVIWGASIAARKDVDDEDGILEQWEFSFDEMRRYRPTPS